jgi:hypothetical protein
VPIAASIFSTPLSPRRFAAKTNVEVAGVSGTARRAAPALSALKWSRSHMKSPSASMDSAIEVNTSPIPRPRRRALSHPIEVSNASATPSTLSTSATSPRPPRAVTDGSSSPTIKRRFAASTLVTERVPFLATAPDRRTARFCCRTRPRSRMAPATPALPVDLDLSGRGHDVGVAETPVTNMEDLAAAVRSALGSSDLDWFAHLLAPDVRWGAPGDPKPPCRSRHDAIRWYERGKAQGRRACVLDVSIHGDRLVVHLRVRDESALVADEEQDRWQVLTCMDGQVVDIRGYETAEEALNRVSDH